MPQVERRVARERAALLRAAGERQFAKLCRSRIGAVESVLVERADMGRTEQFLPVRLSSARPGEIMAIEIAGADASGLDGVPADLAPEHDHGHHSLSARDPRLVHGIA
jgi:threonylcarbamoyladenosine tRNA methylthiotransferase MtaB